MGERTKLTLTRAANWAAYVFMITINVLAVVLPLGGLTTQQVSELYPNLFTPAPFVFSIWGIIYAGQLLFLLYQSGLLGYRRGMDDGLVLRLGLLPCLLSLFNGLWLILWHHRRPLAALAVIAAMLLTLTQLHLRTAGLANRPAKWFVRTPFRLYLGWISVATIANTSVALVQADFSGWGLPEDIWAALLVAFAAVLGAAMLLRHRDYAFAAAMAWALLGIFIRHTLALDGIYSSVVLTSLLGLMAVTGGMAYVFFQGKR